MLPAHPKRNVVLFRSAFAYERAPNITHITLDGEKTACGRRGWETEEGWDSYVSSSGPDCRTCYAKWLKLPLNER